MNTLSLMLECLRPQVDSYLHRMHVWKASMLPWSFTGLTCLLWACRVIPVGLGWILNASSKGFIGWQTFALWLFTPLRMAASIVVLSATKPCVLQHFCTSSKKTGKKRKTPVFTMFSVSNAKVNDSDVYCTCVGTFAMHVMWRPAPNNINNCL